VKQDRLPRKCEYAIPELGCLASQPRDTPPLSTVRVGCVAQVRRGGGGNTKGGLSGGLNELLVDHSGKRHVPTKRRREPTHSGFLKGKREKQT